MKYIGLLVSLFASVLLSSAPAAVTISGPSNVIATEGVAFPFTGGNLFTAGTTSATIRVNFSLNVGAQNSLSVSIVTGVVVSGNASASLTVSGTVANVNASIGTLSYIFTGKNPPPGGRTLTALATSTEGAATNTTAISIPPVNSPPDIVAANNSGVEDTTIAFPVTINDPDTTTASNMQVTISSTLGWGYLVLTSTNGLTFMNTNSMTVVTNIDTGVTNIYYFLGTISNSVSTFQGMENTLSTALSTMFYAPSAHSNGTHTFSISVNDLGAEGAGGAQTTITNLTVTITASNDPPTIGVGGDTKTGFEQVPLQINLGGILRDRDYLDSGTGTLEFAMSVSNGLITLPVTNGLRFVGGTTNGGTSIRVQGVITNIDNAIAPFTYTAPTNFFGNDTLRLFVSDLGNSGAGGIKSNSEVVAVTILPVNDAPVMDTTGNMALTAIDEDNTTNTGSLVSAIIASAGGDRIIDEDGGALEGMAVNDADNSNGAWQYSTDGGSTWLSFGFVSDGEATLVAATSRIRFVPATNFCGSAAFTFRAWDQTSGTNGQTAVDIAGNNGGSTAYSTNSETVAILVNCLNDAPVVDNTAATALPGIDEDTVAPAGDSVSNVLANAGWPISDVDSNALAGIAVVGIDNTAGVWQYSTNGGTSFLAIPAVSGTAALLLDDASWLRFVPAANSNGTFGLVFRAWDRTTGANSATGVNVSVNGGLSAFSSGIETCGVAVANLNEAPVLDNTGTMTLSSIQANDFTSAGTLVSSIIASAGGNRITDLDPGAVEGIAVISANNTYGLWQYSTDSGVNWNPITGVDSNSATLIGSASLVRFVPVPSFSGNVGIQFRAWDQTSGSDGETGADTSINGDPTAFSVAVETASITVLSTNNAPVLDNTGAMVLNAIAQNNTNSAGDVVMDIIGSAGGDRITDPDIGAFEGLAVVGADNSNGSWQYSTDIGASWLAFGSVADVSAVLIDDSALIRFVPNFGFIGTAGLIFRAWDRSDIFANGSTGVDVSVNGGTTAYSSGIETARIDVVSLFVNLAPVLDDSGAMVLPAINEDNFTNTGTTVANVIASAGGDRITDGNTNAVEGLAVIAADQTNGVWQYSQNGGVSWNGFINVSNSSAVLLSPTARVRFIPTANLHHFQAGLTFRAWDQMDGRLPGDQGVDVSQNGGTNSYSIVTETAYITVNEMADLTISKQSSGSYLAGGSFLYRVTVTNKGPSDATNVVVTDVLPPEVVPSGTIVSNLGMIFAGFSKSFVITSTIPPWVRGVLTNVASVTSGVVDDFATNDVIVVLVAVTSQVDLAVSKWPNLALAPAGESYTYTISVSNMGPSDALGVVVTDTLPAQVTFESASSGCVHNAGVVTCPISLLPRWSGTSFWIRVTVGGSIGQSITNLVTVAGADPEITPANNTYAVTNKVGNGRARNDFDADGLSDIAVFAPGSSTWYLQKSLQGLAQVQLGFSGVTPVPGDYDGDGIWDTAVFAPSSATWYIFGSAAGYYTRQWGFKGVTPVPADYDGDNRTDLAVFDPVSANWYVVKSQSNLQSVAQWGFKGVTPVPADYDGDGKADRAVFDPAASKWYLQRTQLGDQVLGLGFKGVVPVPGDFDGDGKSDVAVYDAASGKWYYAGTTAGYQVVQWGFPGTSPVHADYDGDGKTDFAVFDPTPAKWYILKSTGGQIQTQFGPAGSKPVKGAP